MLDLAPFTWILLATAALCVGISKTAIPGLSTVAVALAAATLPAKASTGVLLILLMVGDALALTLYRKHAHWPTLLGLIPAVLAGLVVGAIFLYTASDGTVKRGIGVILLALLMVTLWQRRAVSRGKDAGGTYSRWVRARYGAGAGFTTMVANAGGPMMSLYLLASRFDMKAFLGTSAWFFATINVAKLPFSVGLGIITHETLALIAPLTPLVFLGALAGRALVRRMSQQVFEQLVLVMTLVGALYLLV